MIDPEKETVFSTTISLAQDQGETGVIPLLRETFSSYAAAVFNDTACAAYAEKIYTAILEKDYAFIRFSRGIGAALFIQDRLLGRACASYTQFGHFSISPQGPPCPCGKKTAAWSWFSRKKPCPDGFMPKEPPPPFFPCPPSAMPTWGEPPFMGTRQRFR